MVLAAYLACTVHAEDVNCNGGMVVPNNAAALLSAYAQRTVDDPESFSIAGVGNHLSLLDQDQNPISAKELAASIQASPHYKQIKRVILIWSYSKYDNAPYARELERIVKKPVLGFSGPVWWYPDGSAFASKAEMANMQGPNKTNVAECLTSDGKYHRRDECIKYLDRVKSAEGIFGNFSLTLTCDQIAHLEPLAKQGDPNANMKLFFMSHYVNILPNQAADYLAKAAYSGVPLANYLLARTFADRSPPNLAYYRQFLKVAADGGNKKAKRELEALNP